MPLLQILIGQPEGAVVAHEAAGVGGGWDFGEAIAGEADLVEAGEEAAEGIFLKVEVAHVDDEDFVFHEVEVMIEALACEIGLVGVPADAGVLVVGDLDDTFDIREE